MPFIQGKFQHSCHQGQLRVPLYAEASKGRLSGNGASMSSSKRLYPPLSEYPTLLEPARRQTTLVQ